jgi:hypothetical protein
MRKIVSWNVVRRSQNMAAYPMVLPTRSGCHGNKLRKDDERRNCSDPNQEITVDDTGGTSASEMLVVALPIHTDAAYF